MPPFESNSNPTIQPPIKAIIVDDERLARLELRQALAEYPDHVEVVGEASSKREALELLASLRGEHSSTKYPEVLFLDITMPHGSGFDVVEELGELDDDNAMPLSIVFVTAYDEYALRAFEVNALDYVLKPIDPDRLERTMRRLWSIHRNRQPANSALKMPPSEHVASAESAEIGSTDTGNISAESAISAPIAKLTLDDYMFVTMGKQRRFIVVSEIVCITANDNYTDLWLPDGKHAMMLRTMNEWEAMLPSPSFQRIHRSTIVNTSYFDAARPIEPSTGGGALVYLVGIAEPFAMSRRMYAKWKEGGEGKPSTNGETA